MSLPVTAHRLRLLVLPFVIVTVVACGGGAAATAPADGSDPEATEPGATEPGADDASLAPAGARSFFTFDPRSSALVRVDPDNGQVDEVVDLEGSAYAMAQGEGALWLGMDTGTVVRVDPATGTTLAEIAPTAKDGLFDLAVADGAAWALHGVPGLGGSLVRIDAATNTAGEPIAAAGGISFFDVEADGGAVWLVGSSKEMATTLYAVDPATGALTDQKVQMVIDAIAAGDGAVWLSGTIFPSGATGVPGIAKFDPASRKLTTLELPAEAGSLAIGSGGVWAAAGVGPDGSVLYRIDPADVSLAATIPLGDFESGRIKVSTGAGAAWVTTDDTTYAVDAGDNTVAGDADSMGTLGLFFPAE